MNNAAATAGLEWRTVLVALAAALLAGVGLYAALGPRPVSPEDVRMLCEREVRRQTLTIGNRVVEGYTQTGLEASFTLRTLGDAGAAPIPVSCTVGGNGRKPTVALEMRR
ncbi:hypothetical protein DAERI_220004 [Deinococcus aerius]|uniref:DUF4333 domain-containing protein n=1 Tax=Deinococcus aerius TaxID=200253 RepID=A0A2I9DRM2_9DEIO|nr:hypothetical protein [Deinococcus aerius]GBF08061.1 hypothetical protein DAERI_220004 [Deinococcus aerius]